MTDAIAADLLPMSLPALPIRSDPLPITLDPLLITLNPLTMWASRIQLSTDAEGYALGAAAVTAPTKNLHAERVEWGRATSSDRAIFYRVIHPFTLNSLILSLETVELEWLE